MLIKNKNIIVLQNDKEYKITCDGREHHNIHYYNNNERFIVSWCTCDCNKFKRIIQTTIQENGL